MSTLNLLRRVGVTALRAGHRRGGGADGWPGGSFWSEGTQTGRNGFLFGEVPPPPGHTRQLMWWEPIWYLGYGGFFAGVYFMYQSKPLEAFDIKYWAQPRAASELATELRMLDALEARPDLADRLKGVAKQLRLVDDEIYDLVLMRKEYKVLLGLHDGRVPAELKDIYDELQAAAAGDDAA